MKAKYYDNKPKVIYTVRSRLLEAINEARKREKAENPELKDPFHGVNLGFTSIERQIGIHHYSLYKALNGNGNLTVNTLIKLAEYTGVSIDYLLGLDDRKYLTGREPKC